MRWPRRLVSAEHVAGPAARIPMLDKDTWSMAMSKKRAAQNLIASSAVLI